MHEPLQGYRGRIIGSAGNAEPNGAVAAEPVVPVDPAALIDDARGQADEILQRARIEAEQDYHETLIGQLLEIVAEHRAEILKSRGPLLEMALQAVETIIGKVPDAERQKMAFEQAVKSFADTKSLTIRAASDVFPRYKIIVLGANNLRLGRLVNLVEDKDLAQGRCLIEADGRTYDVDAASQVAAFSRSARRIANGDVAK